MNMTANCDVTNIAHQIQMTTICHWMNPPRKCSAYATSYSCLRSTVTCSKRPVYRYLKWIFVDLLPCYCYAIKTNSRTIRSQVSQPSSAGKSGFSKCKLVIAWCVRYVPDQRTWLLCSVSLSVIPVWSEISDLYCLPSILLLRVTDQSLAITLLICCVNQNFLISCQIPTTSYRTRTGITITTEKYWA